MKTDAAKIADLALKCSERCTELVDNPVDMVLVLATMSASMCKTLAGLKLGYCAASAMCLSIDYMLQMMKEINEAHEHLDRKDPGTDFMAGLRQKAPTGPVEL